MGRSAKPDPSKTYVAWQTAAIAEIPGRGMLRRGERYPGDHWLVEKRPEFFLEDGENLEQRMRERLAESIATARSSAA